MKKRTTIRISPQGTVHFVNSELTRKLVEKADHATLRRASHVEPVSRPLRLCFHLLRRAFGEEGRASDWTRRWGCLWQINLSPSRGSVMGPFQCRQTAIDAEVDWLHNNRLGLS